MSEEHDKFQGRMTGPQFEPRQKDGLFIRLVFMVLIWVMLSLASTVLGVATVIQFVVMVINKGEPNPRLAEFGESLGIWIAKAARYQTAASDVKPWPWTELD
ncbi:DUF4389 domain-containing protein [Psychromarinibacter halotolerans]|uniref:DUF4389 domain-containing protein n=1 Tax=Psychromarinibacter halotolerans TaxID=1775175 RepID=A0ABV7GR19_9RHOB|nr:DUF4389 domain-containing protein [Psychromarinibacter halotolerans]MAQ84305.1 hypothetical protein [Maritimibacter sp.]MDF0597204.1 DUF4389 domain-containing protein [Psychromarinibacter halotolerans]